MLHLEMPRDGISATLRLLQGCVLRVLDLQLHDVRLRYMEYDAINFVKGEKNPARGHLGDLFLSLRV